MCSHFLKSFQSIKNNIIFIFFLLNAEQHVDESRKQLFYAQLTV